MTSTPPKKLQDVGVGDFVIRTNHGYTGCPVKVARLTKTQIIIHDGKRYRKKDGGAVDKDDTRTAIRVPKEGELEEWKKSQEEIMREHEERMREKRDRERGRPVGWLSTSLKMLKEGGVECSNPFHQLVYMIYAELEAAERDMIRIGADLKALGESFQERAQASRELWGVHPPGAMAVGIGACDRARTTERLAAVALRAVADRLGITVQDIRERNAGD